MNHYEYFSEIEERFSQRRGSVLLLSTLDWALIETWREAGVPLEAVLRGIDNAFDKYQARAAKAGARSRKINGLAWCAQAVMHAAEEMVEAATGTAHPRRPTPDSGFESGRVAAFLQNNAKALQMAAGAHNNKIAVWIPVAETTAARLLELAQTMRSAQPIALEELDRALTNLEERLFAALETSLPEDLSLSIKAHAEQELAPYRSRMSAVQLRQVQQQFRHKRLLELHNLPRLSLFYMAHDE